MEEKLQQLVTDCHALDRRVMTLELQTKQKGEEIDKEINSLRATRHEYGNVLTKHALEIDQLQYRAHSIESDHGVTSLGVEALKNAVSELKSDMRLTLWKIGLLMGVALLVMNRVLNKIGL